MTNDSVYVVHERLMNAATERLVENATVHVGEIVSDAEGRIGRAMQQVAYEAYTRGVRDGYVQAVAEQGEK